MTVRSCLLDPLQGSSAVFLRGIKREFSAMLLIPGTFCPILTGCWSGVCIFSVRREKAKMIWHLSIFARVKRKSVEKPDMTDDSRKEELEYIAAVEEIAAEDETLKASERPVRLELGFGLGEQHSAGFPPRSKSEYTLGKRPFPGTFRRSGALQKASTSPDFLATASMTRKKGMKGWSSYRIC